MKTYKILPMFALVISLTFCLKTSFAQYPGMGALYSKMNSASIHQHMYGGTFGFKNTAEYNPSYTYIVTFKDSTKTQVESRIYSDTSLHKSYLLLVNDKFPRKDPKRKQKNIP